MVEILFGHFYQHFFSFQLLSVCGLKEYAPSKHSLIVYSVQRYFQFLEVVGIFTTCSNMSANTVDEMIICLRNYVL